MKKIVSFVAVAFLVGSISVNTFAHSHLADSNPKDGEVITNSIQEIKLDFDGKIMQGSYIEVTSTEGASFEVDTIEIGEGQLMATLANPLPNGEYKVDWSIISADGHPLEGAYSFTVNVPVSNTTTPTENTEIKDGQFTDTTENSNIFMYVVIGVAVVILVIGGILLRRKK
jgi:copper resistance protein C